LEKILLLAPLVLGDDYPKTAVGPDFVLVLAPFSNAISGLWQALKPLFIQTFVSELSIETLDIAVLHRPARLNQNVANAVQCGPSQEGSSCEFRPVTAGRGQVMKTEEPKLFMIENIIYIS
jgi:hypothetical protein